MIMPDNNTTTPSKQGNEEFAIDLVKIMSKIVAVRKTLYKAAGVGLLIGILIAFSIPKVYTVTVTFSPEMNGESRAVGGLAGIASSFLGGASINSSPDALNASLSADIISSTPFCLELLDCQVQTLDGEIDTTLAAYLNEERIAWFYYIPQVPNLLIGAVKSLFTSHDNETTISLDSLRLTPQAYLSAKKLNRAITVEKAKQAVMTDISVTLQDPKVAAIVADSVIRKLQSYITDYRIRKAKEDCTYLEQLYRERREEYYQAQERYAHYMDANHNIALQRGRVEQERLQNDMNLAYQVYSQVAQQLQLARAKIQEAKPVFAVVEPPIIPLHTSGHSRIIVAGGIMALVLLLTVGWKLVGESGWEKLRKYVKRYKNETLAKSN